MYKHYSIGTFITCALGELYTVGIYELPKSTLNRYASAVMEKAKSIAPDIGIVLENGTRNEIDFVNSNLWTIEVVYGLDPVFKVRNPGADFLDMLKTCRDEIAPEHLPAFQSVEAREALGIKPKVEPSSLMNSVTVKFMPIDSSDLVKKYPEIDTKILFDYIVHSEDLDLTFPDCCEKDRVMYYQSLQYSTHFKVTRNHIRGVYTMEVRFHFNTNARTGDPNGMEKEYFFYLDEKRSSRDTSTWLRLLAYTNLCAMKDGYIDIEFYVALSNLINSAYQYHENKKLKERLKVEASKYLYFVTDQETNKHYGIMKSPYSGNLRAYEVSVDLISSVDPELEKSILELAEEYKENQSD